MFREGYAWSDHTPKHYQKLYQFAFQCHTDISYPFWISIHINLASFTGQHSFSDICREKAEGGDYCTCFHGYSQKNVLSYIGWILTIVAESLYFHAATTKLYNIQSTKHVRHFVFTLVSLLFSHLLKLWLHLSKTHNSKAVALG